MDEEEDELRFARCPRCGVFDPRRVDDDAEGPCRPNFAIQNCHVCGLGGVSRSPIRGGYWKSDLLEVVDEPPMMGKPCLHCGSRIPKFLDLEGDERARIYQLIRSDRHDEAVDALVTATGCPASWARTWVTHPFGPRRPLRRWAGPPCLYCGLPLRTMLARQCLECGKDWHDPDNIRQLK